METIYSNWLVGTDPSALSFDHSSTQADLDITFFATTQQEIDLSFYGSSSFSIAMFGEETSFQFSSTDAQCKYTPSFSLDPDSSGFNIKLAAMNYTVTLLENSVPAPIFSYDTDRYACSEPTQPYASLVAAGRLTQDVTIITANDS